MASSSKKKRKRKSEFQKVKIKVGRRVQKANNETKTVFKTKKIQIREQCMKIATPVGKAKKKFNLEDFYHGMRNHNVNCRKDALVSFKNAMSNNSEAICQNIGNVLQQVMKLLEDKMADIRKLTVGIIKNILTMAGKDRLKLVFPTISSHLSSAMTHVHPDIQKDSFELLDFLLDHHPDYLVASYDVLLPNFLEQISYQKVPHATNTMTMGARALTINPNKKQAEQIWRFTVFQRLCRFLKSLLKIARDKTVFSSTSAQEINWSMENELYISPNVQLRLVKDELYNFSGTAAFDAVSVNGRTCGILDNRQDLQLFVSSLMPLIFQSWRESSPAKSISNSRCFLPLATLEYMKCLLDIMYYLVECICLSERLNTKSQSLLLWFELMYKKDFLHYFIHDFPFVVDDTQQSMHKKPNKLRHSGLSTEFLCSEVNLLLCNIFMRMETQSLQENESIWKKFVAYLNYLLLDNGRIIGNMKFIIETMNNLFQKEELQNVQEQILPTLCHVCTTLPSGNDQRKHIEHFLQGFILGNQCNKIISSCPSFTRWIVSLPNSLRTVDAWEVVSVITQIAVLENDTFLDGLGREMVSLIEWLCKLKKHDRETVRIQRTALELLIRVPHLRKADFLALTGFMRSDAVSQSVQLYCLQVLSCRYTYNLKVWQCESPSYIGFLLNVLIGFSDHELKNLLPSKSMWLRVPNNIVIMEGFEKKWQRHRVLVKEIGNYFNQLENLDQVNMVIAAYLAKLTVAYNPLPLLSTRSVALLIQQIQFFDNLKEDQTNLQKISRLLASSIVTESIYSVTSFQNYYSYLLSFNWVTEEIFCILTRSLEGLKTTLEMDNMLNILHFLLLEKKLSAQQILRLRDYTTTIYELFGEEIQKYDTWHSLQYEMQLQSLLK